MKETRILMGMPITVEITDPAATPGATEEIVRAVFDYFKYIDEKFSPYKATSELAAVNEGRLAPGEQSEDMKTIFLLAEKTKWLTDGYFDIKKPNRRTIRPAS